MPRPYHRKSYDYRPAVLIGCTIACFALWVAVGYSIAQHIAG